MSKTTKRAQSWITLKNLPSYQPNKPTATFQETGETNITNHETWEVSSSLAVHHFNRGKCFLILLACMLIIIVISISFSSIAVVLWWERRHRGTLRMESKSEERKLTKAEMKLKGCGCHQTNGHWAISALQYLWSIVVQWRVFYFFIIFICIRLQAKIVLQRIMA